jgi:hypothetical protein
MNIFYHNEDPLLYQRSQTPFFQDGQQQPLNPNQMTDMYAHLYKQQLIKEMQQQNAIPQQKDWIGELDKMMKNLDNTTVEQLNNNQEFVSLNNQLQSMIQGEIMSLVKLKLNNYPTVGDNVKKQIEIIEDTEKKIKKVEKQNMNELNDYIQNYSNLTFDEYKKLKYGAKPTKAEIDNVLENAKDENKVDNNKNDNVVENTTNENKNDNVVENTTNENKNDTVVDDTNKEDTTTDAE